MIKTRYILLIAFLSLFIQQSCNKKTNKNQEEIPENFDPSFVLLTLNKDHANLILEDVANGIFYLGENSVEQMIQKHEHADLILAPVTEENGIYTHTFKASFKEQEGLPLIVKTKIFQDKDYQVESKEAAIVVDQVKNRISIKDIDLFPIAQLQDHLEKSALATLALDVDNKKLTVQFGKKTKVYDIQEIVPTDVAITQFALGNILGVVDGTTITLIEAEEAISAEQLKNSTVDLKEGTHFELITTENLDDLSIFIYRLTTETGKKYDYTLTITVDAAKVFTPIAGHEESNGVLYLQDQKIIVTELFDLTHFTLANSNVKKTLKDQNKLILQLRDQTKEYNLIVFDPSFVLLTLNKDHANLILEDAADNIFYVDQNNVEQMIQKHQYATLILEAVTEDNGLYIHTFKAKLGSKEAVFTVKTKLFQAAYYEVTSTNQDILINNVNNTIQAIGISIDELTSHLEKSILATWTLDVDHKKLTVAFGKKNKIYQIEKKLNLWEQGSYKDASITEIRPTNISSFKRNSEDYQHEKKEQLRNYDVTDWVVNDIYKPTTNVLNNHPAFFNSPRYAKTKDKNDNYNYNTLYALADGKGELLKKGEGQFGSSLTIVSQASALFGLQPAIPGQLTNAQPYADGTSGAKLGFVATEKDSDNTFNSRPNGLVVYFKYRPKGSDKAVFEVSLHKGAGLKAEDARLPAKFFGATATSNYKTVDENVVAYGAATVVGTLTDDWYRAFVPIYYKDDSGKPEHIILNITSSDLTNGTADKLQGGSELEIDRIVFAY